MLNRVTYVSAAAGPLGTSVLAMAQILGQAEANNRRDRITGALMIHEGRVLQVIEGARADLDRLLTRLRADRRHDNMVILSDRPVATRLFEAPLAHCPVRSCADGIDLNEVLAGRVPADVVESLLAACSGEHGPQAEMAGARSA